MKNNKIGVNSTPQPQAWVAVSNNRQKIYGAKDDLVYLDAGQEFQIELYNPTSTSYLAKIYLNDKSISNSGLILKPGQRYFLDRYLDEKKKLLFSIYDVENTEEVQEAIKNNGKVRVEFYPENSIPSWSSMTVMPGQITWTHPTYTNPPTYWGGSYGSGTPNVYVSNTGGIIGTLSGSTLTTSGAGSTYTTSASVNSSFRNSSISSTSIETGRIEKGGSSNQDFSSGYGNYSFLCSHKSEYQILPRSVKPVEVSEIREYCTGCGSRIKKKTWKFCPSCGESLD
jgi:hypothetical protein